MNQNKPTELNRIKFLDGFRFLLAFWVVTGHFYTLIGGVMFIKLPKALLKSLNNPIVAVYGFMVITGFLMTYNYLNRERKEPWDDFETFIKFWLRRLFRLYPVYVLMITLAFFNFVSLAKINESNLIFFTGSNVIQGDFVRSVEQPSLQDFLSHLFLIHGLFPSFHDSILGVTWSLSLEMQFYFLFPFIFLFVFAGRSMLRNRLIVFSLFCSFAAILSPKAIDFITGHYGLRSFRLPSVLIYTSTLFLLGMISAGVKLKRFNPVYLTVVLVLTIPFQLLITNIVIGLFLTFLFLDELQSVIPQYLYKVLDYCRSLLSGKLASRGADLSYSLYLVHTMLIGILLRFVINNSTRLNLSKLTIACYAFGLLIIVCILVCWLIFHLIEKPFIELGKSVIKRTLSRKTEIQVTQQTD